MCLQRSFNGQLNKFHLHLFRINLGAFSWILQLTERERDRDLDRKSERERERWNIGRWALEECEHLGRGEIVFFTYVYDFSSPSVPRSEVCACLFYLCIYLSHSTHSITPSPSHPTSFPICSMPSLSMWIEANSPRPNRWEKPLKQMLPVIWFEW